MAYLADRRRNWHRLIGVERRGAPFRTLLGRPLPDPTQLLDEDFEEAKTGEVPHPNLRTILERRDPKRRFKP